MRNLGGPKYRQLGKRNAEMEVGNEDELVVDVDELVIDVDEPVINVDEPVINVDVDDTEVHNRKSFVWDHFTYVKGAMKHQCPYCKAWLASGSRKHVYMEKREGIKSTEVDIYLRDGTERRDEKFDVLDWLRSTPADVEDMQVNDQQLEDLVENLAKIELGCSLGEFAGPIIVSFCLANVPSSGTLERLVSFFSTIEDFDF
ncbi:hypothetical protein Tco_0582994 [Tanacetum coccineum]